MSVRSIIHSQRLGSFKRLPLQMNIHRQFSCHPILLKEKPKSAVKIPKGQADAPNTQAASNADYSNHIRYLTKFYEPEIVESILLAESAIDPKHYSKTKLNSMEFAPSYIDDFIKLDPYFDHPEKKPTSAIEVQRKDLNTYYPGQHFSNLDPNGDIPTNKNYYFDNFNTFQTQPDRSGLFENKSVQELAEDETQPELIGEEDSMDDVDGDEDVKKLSKLTGLTVNYIQSLAKVTIMTKMVSNQTGLGKIPSYFAMVAVGDRNGMLGVGQGKDAASIPEAISKAYWDAVKNLVQIPLLDNRTIYGEVQYKFGGSIVHLKTAPTGYGLRVNHNIFKLAECAGIKDMSAKVYKSRNSMNVVKATLGAFLKQKTNDDLALERGKKVVDLKKIYYSSEE